ncbi:hypothetical protein [Stappia sp. ES.058]|uniref:hypothetical protein n=1 Tax=Stappia sp. ES.058 TaxID=1881061 RepID=UPI000B89A93A|nr:hypothetical protein [Stappia sp. ES.058]
MRDLWAITETLVDQSLSLPFYPLQLSVACEVFDALEQEIAAEATKAQLKKGDDLASQENRCREFVACKGYQVV